MESLTATYRPAIYFLRHVALSFKVLVRRLPSQKPGIPSAAHFAPPIPTVRFADAEEVGRAAFYARPLSCLPPLLFSRLLDVCSFPDGEGERGKRGRGELKKKKKKEKRERESVCEEGRGKKNWWKFRGEEKRPRKRGERKARRGGGGPGSSPIGSLATGSPTFNSQSFLASMAYFDCIRESLERRGAISWRTWRDPFADASRMEETRGI